MLRRCLYWMTVNIRLIHDYLLLASMALLVYFDFGIDSYDPQTATMTQQDCCGEI